MTPMSSDTFDLVEAARHCALSAWPKGKAAVFGFTKAGIILDDLLPIEDRGIVKLFADEDTGRFRCAGCAPLCDECESDFQMVAGERYASEPDATAQEAEAVFLPVEIESMDSPVPALAPIPSGRIEKVLAEGYRQVDQLQSQF